MASAPVFRVAGGYAVATFGDLTAPRAAPEPWEPASLIYLLDQRGSVRDSVGTVTRRSGRYRTWLFARTVAGAVRDTILIVRTSTGTVSGWIRPYNVWSWHFDLPHSIASPVPQEDYWQYPWIQFGGETRNFIDVPQIGVAAIASDGVIYAVRNYAARWEARKLYGLKTTGTWRVTAALLEKYSQHGKLLGRFKLPAPEVSWLSAGLGGRLFFRTGRDVYAVETDDAPRRCRDLPPRIQMTVNDSEPSPEQPAVAVSPASSGGR